MAADITIRRMTEKDVPAAVALERECFSEPWSENAYRDTLADENAVYIVAEADGSFAGMCGLLNILGEGDINNVAVKETFRRQGIAERMLAELLAQGKARGIAAFTLEVRASNAAAIGLYEKLGFACEGRRKNFYAPFRAGEGCRFGGVRRAGEENFPRSIVQPREDALILWRREENQGKE